MRKLLSLLSILGLFAIVFYACKKDASSASAANTANATSNGSLATPTITCATADDQFSIKLRVTAGSTGAPAGFSIQWMKKSEFEVYGWAGDGTEMSSYCGASFSGNPSCSSYNLGANQSIYVTLGDNMYNQCGVSSSCTGGFECTTEYVFRIFAHNVPGRNGLGKSDFSSTLSCMTDFCAS